MGRSTGGSRSAGAGEPTGNCEGDHDADAAAPSTDISDFARALVAERLQLLPADLGLLALRVVADQLLQDELGVDLVARIGERGGEREQRPGDLVALRILEQHLVELD